jgi:hypothetical protein
VTTGAGGGGRDHHQPPKTSASAAARQRHLLIGAALHAFSLFESRRARMGLMVAAAQFGVSSTRIAQ